MDKVSQEDWEYLKYSMDDEGFHYCFDGYSNWTEIKDERFQELRSAYLKAADELKSYIESKVNV